MLGHNYITVLEAWLAVLNLFHFAFTILFLICFFKVLFQKYSPYCQLYMAGFLIVQVSWDGCPIASFINIFNNLGGYSFEYNGFFFGAAGEWTQPLRFLGLLMMGLLTWSAFETWYKTDTPVDFANYMRKGTFQME
jgi:hypothetical protein